MHIFTVQSKPYSKTISSAGLSQFEKQEIIHIIKYTFTFECFAHKQTKCGIFVNQISPSLAIFWRHNFGKMETTKMFMILHPFGNMNHEHIFCKHLKFFNQGQIADVLNKMNNKSLQNCYLSIFCTFFFWSYSPNRIPSPPPHPTSNALQLLNV